MTWMLLCLVPSSESLSSTLKDEVTIYHCHASKVHPSTVLWFVLHSMFGAAASWCLFTFALLESSSNRLPALISVSRGRRQFVDCHCGELLTLLSYYPYHLTDFIIRPQTIHFDSLIVDFPRHRRPSKTSTTSDTKKPRQPVLFSHMSEMIIIGSKSRKTGKPQDTRKTTTSSTHESCVVTFTECLVRLLRRHREKSRARFVQVHWNRVVRTSRLGKKGRGRKKYSCY